MTMQIPDWVMNTGYFGKVDPETGNIVRDGVVVQYADGSYPGQKNYGSPINIGSPLNPSAPGLFQPGNPYLEVIEAESPRQVFEAFAPGNLMPGQRNAFSNLFTPSFSQFLGEEAKRFAGGNNQPYSFTQFLSNQFDPRRELLKQTASQTGQNTSRLTGGSARFLTF